MRITISCAILISLFLCSFEAAFAQDKVLPKLREYPPEQRWARLEQNCNSIVIGAIGYAKSLGRTSDDFAKYLIKEYAPTWGTAGSGQPMAVLRGMRYNIMSFPTARFELIDSLENKVIGRYGRWYAPIFKDKPSVFGVTLDDYEGLFRAFNRGVAEDLGLTYEDQVEGEWVTFTLAKK